MLRCLEMPGCPRPVPRGTPRLFKEVAAFGRRFLCARGSHGLPSAVVADEVVFMVVPVLATPQPRRAIAGAIQLEAEEGLAFLSSLSFSSEITRCCSSASMALSL